MTLYPIFKKPEDYTTDPDVVLMLEFQNGNPRSFEVLMRKYYPRVLNFLYRYGLNRHAAEDLTQEIFLKIHQMGANYRPQAKFQTFLYTIVRNSALNAIRNERKYAVSLDEEIESEEGSMVAQQADDKSLSPLEEMLEDEKSARIQAVINELPENQRSAVFLKRYEKMSYEEIAQSLNCSPKAVKSLLNRAKETLKVKLTDI
ncbi:MAG: sigma-70 family RNA polymerase sigma factor [Candidatus Omnitrophica bacterium]|nr:sigma-70 family RNA polymerase sigma factor [Candidatus Omnitrophota bacterium]